MIGPLIRRRSILVAALAVACGHYESRAAMSRVTMEHGIKVGDSVPPTALDCGTGVKRVVGSPRRIDLVTFASAGDCSICQAHLVGLQALHVTRRLPVSDYVVLWAPDSQDVRLAEFLRRESARPICLGGAALWIRYHLAHTPVTALVDSGKVVYLHDEQLASEAAQDTLVSDLRSFVLPHQ